MLTTPDIESINRTRKLQAPHGNQEKGRNRFNRLNLDIFLSLFPLLDTISLLNFQAVDKFSRCITEHGQIWLDRWMWRNSKLEGSLPRGFFNDYTSLKFENEEVKKRKHERASVSKIKIGHDDRKKLIFGDIIGIENNFCDAFNNGASTANKVSFRKVENAKKYKKDFSLLRNVDVTIIQLILQVVQCVRPLSDLTEYYLHTTHKFLSVNSFSHFLENYRSFQARGDGNRYFHSIYLLTVIIDINSDTYSKEFRVKFLQNILGDVKYNDTTQLDIEHSETVGGHDGKTSVEVILSSPSIQNIARLAFLFMRSQLQYFKWNDTLHLLSPACNRNLAIENKAKPGCGVGTKIYESEGNLELSNTGASASSASKIPDSTDGGNNNIDSSYCGEEKVVTEMKQNENTVVESEVQAEERFTVCEAFMILADSKSTDDQLFCDRAYANRVIDRLVFLVHEKIFQSAVFDHDIDILRSRVSRMDRTYVVKILISLFSPNPQSAHSITNSSREFSFTGNSTDYYNGLNSFIDNVAHSQKGLPISLSALFVTVANKCGLGGLNITGLNGHVLISVFRRNFVYNENTEESIRKNKRMNVLAKCKYDCLKISNVSNAWRNRRMEINHEFDDDFETEYKIENLEKGLLNLAEIGNFQDSYPSELCRSKQSKSRDNRITSPLKAREAFYFIDVFRDGALMSTREMEERFSIEDDETAFKTPKKNIFVRSIRNLIWQNGHEHRYLWLSQSIAILEWEFIQILLTLNNENKKIFEMEKRRSGEEILTQSINNIGPHWKYFVSLGVALIEDIKTLSEIAASVGLSHAVMICAERIEWIKNSKSLIATRRASDDTMVRKNKKTKDEEFVEKEKMHGVKGNADMEDVQGKKDGVNEKEEEKEMRVSREYDVYYDTFITAIKGSRLYN